MQYFPTTAVILHYPYVNTSPLPCSLIGERMICLHISFWLSDLQVLPFDLTFMWEVAKMPLILLLTGSTHTSRQQKHPKVSWHSYYKKYDGSIILKFNIEHSRAFRRLYWNTLHNYAWESNMTPLCVSKWASAAWLWQTAGTSWPFWCLFGRGSVRARRREESLWLVIQLISAEEQKPVASVAMISPTERSFYLIFCLFIWRILDKKWRYWSAVKVSW